MGLPTSILYSPCPCGSGRKFKFCCLGKIRHNLPDFSEWEDVVMEVRKLEKRKRDGEEEEVDDNAFAKLQDGLELARNGDYGRAIVVFRELRTEYPGFNAAWNGEAQFLFVSGDVDAAFSLLDEALRVNVDNYFGWALLADMHYCQDNDEAYGRCIERAVSGLPSTTDIALRVCSALSRTKRHREILDYARRSLFLETPRIAFYAGVAAMNCGDPDAPGLLRTAMEDDDFGHLAEAILDEMGGDKTPPPSAVGGCWPYFDADCRELGFSGDNQVPTGINVVCDQVEALLWNNHKQTNEALALLEKHSGPRVEALRANIAKLAEVNEEAESAMSELIEKIKAEAPDNPYTKALLATPEIFNGVSFDYDFEPYGELPSDAVYDEYNGAIDNYNSLRGPNGSVPRSATKSGNWNSARETLARIWRENPWFLPARYNYAVMLMDEGNCAKAEIVLEELAAEHPEYPYPVAKLLNFFCRTDNLVKAAGIADQYRLPARIHPDYVKTWLLALAGYCRTIEDNDRLMELHAAMIWFQRWMRDNPDPDGDDLRN